MNGIVKTKDKTDSLYRRFIWVPFPKNFEGSERKEIKQIFLADPEVLSYILWHALHTEFGGSPESPVYDVPMSCQTLLEEVKVDNDTVRQFWAEYADKFAWDVVPNSFLYDTFKASGHYGQNNIGSRDFYKRLKAIVAEQAKQGGHWDAPKDPITVGKRMDAPEPLILRFNMMAWMNQGARGSNDPDKVCRPIPPVQTRGLVRIVPRTAAAVGPLDDGSSFSGDGTARARKVTVDDLAALEARGFPIADSSSGSQDNRSDERS
jgi:putative DNA primase/helicase